MPIDQLDQIDWRSFPQPEWNTPDAVPHALALLATVTDDKTSTDAYYAVLFAFGNNHAGTVYPVAIPAMAFLRSIAADGQGWACATVLDILIDLITFEPEPGYETVMLADGQTISLTIALRHEIQQLRSLAEHIAHDRNRSESLRALAHEFLKKLDTV
jgi:hypothetical protein